MVRSVRTIVLGVLLLLGGGSFGPLAVSSHPQPPITYNIIDLGTLGGFSSVALAINENGQVVGSADTPEGLRHAFLWEDGVMTDLGTLPNDSQSEAWDINNFGVAAGISVTGGEKAVIWENGEVIYLGTFGGESDANGINDRRQVVGTSEISGFESHGFLWEDGVMTDLTLLGFPGGASDINQAGDVAGGCCLWEDGVVTHLGTLGGDDLTGAWGMNDKRQVVGESERVPGERIFYAFLWDNGEIVDLDAIGDIPARVAWAVNNIGQVVGTPSFLYDPDTGMHNLEELIPPDSGWSELSPRGINDAGWMVGSGTGPDGRHAFLMKPPGAIPTVSEWGILVMSLLLVVAGMMMIARPRPVVETQGGSSTPRPQSFNVTSLGIVEDRIEYFADFCLRLGKRIICKIMLLC